jgi:hypothetical protein
MSMMFNREALLELAGRLWDDLETLDTEIERAASVEQAVLLDVRRNLQRSRSKLLTMLNGSSYVAAGMTISEDDEPVADRVNKLLREQQKKRSME